MKFPEPHPEIVIASNIGIFASLLTLAKHGRDAHPNLSSIVPSHWLDRVLSSYYGLELGATCLWVA
jgi:hypothetical protein